MIYGVSVRRYKLKGLRRSPILWQKELTKTFIELGFRKILKDTYVDDNDQEIVEITNQICDIQELEKAPAFSTSIH